MHVPVRSRRRESSSNAAFATLIVHPLVPPPLVLPAQKAAFTGAEQLAEHHLSHYRVNPKITNPVQRDAACLSGTATILSAEIAVKHGLTRSELDEAVARVSASDCAGASLLMTESRRGLAAANVDAQLIETVAAEFFRRLDDRLRTEPKTASSLGWSQAPT